MTRILEAPWEAASWIAARPMEEAPAWKRRDWEGLKPPIRKRACVAVNQASGMEAAVSKLIVEGLRMRVWVETVMYSAYA